ncbi:MAG: hypothetical protein JXJ17_06085 [Anaerolineae bacterium]|nr:hypothetical protein [Anaerolineae bacterium]
MTDVLRKPASKLVMIWLAWALIVIGFQAYATARLELQPPDYALIWTPESTTPGSQDDRTYLNEPFMNRQVAWDSEYYLSIATGGYEDPEIWSLQSPDGQSLSGNYAFFPFYPFLIRIVRLPLLLFGLTPIGASALGGVIVSLLGTLTATFALYDMTREELEEKGAIRTAFYLLICPAGFFLAMVYTEGLFVGLAFGSMALVRRKRWGWSALLAACAVWTRSVGVALVVPLAVAWLKEIDWKHFSLKPFPWKLVGKGLLVLIPLAAYWLWRRFFNIEFTLLEYFYFGRERFAWQKAREGWEYAYAMFRDGHIQSTAYYGLEFAATIFGTLACLLTLRKYPGVSLFGLVAIFIAVTSGAPQGMHRYVMVAPAVFVVLSRAGRSEVFDRAWTILSTLLMGLYAMLYAFDFWAG